MNQTIIREWRGRTPRDKADAYESILDATGFKEYRETPGHLGTLALREDGADTAEFLLLTAWESEAAIRNFAGEDIGKAVYYPEDDEYLLEKPPRLKHYRVIRAEGDWPVRR